MKQSILVTFLFIVSSFVFAQKRDTEGNPIAGSLKGPRYGVGQDSVECVKNLSLYRENYRQWRDSKFKSEAINYTIGPWRYVFLNCPLASENIYIDGSKIIEYLYNNTNDPKLKMAYIDTLRMLYDQRIMAFGKNKERGEAFILGRKGLELITYLPDNIEECYKIFERSVKLGGNNSESSTLYYYFVTTVRMVREKGLDSSKVFENYDIVMNAIDYNINQLQKIISEQPTEAEKHQKNLQSFQNVAGNVENLFEPFATCDNLIKIYQPKFSKNPKDAELLKKIITSFEKKNCNHQLYFDASEALYEIEPNANSAFALGRTYYKLEQYDKAIKYFTETVNNSTDNNQKADAYMFLANIYRIQKNFSAARTNALKVTELRPNDGSPWILIGDLYAMSASMCGDNPVTQKAAYWAAVDKYIKARNVDQSEQNVATANSRISTYSSYFPKTTDLFFYGYKVGDSYKVECWINETTTIRGID